MKNQLRLFYKQQRELMSTEQVTLLSEQITHHLVNSSLWKTSQTIMVYLSFRNEVDTTSLIDLAWSQGKTIIIPICKAPYTIIPSLLSSWNHLIPNRYGILELPSDDIRPVDPLTIDLILVPGIAFDHHGNRLGFGAGYYDRFMPQLRSDARKAALCFAQQISPTPLPAEEHDLPMNYLVSERGISSPLQ